MLRLSNISKKYEAVPVVDSVDLKLAAGRTYALIGPSGCGKSTLLRIMIGLISPDRGEVYLQDQLLTPGNANSLRAEFGYVIQSGGLFPHFTCRENVTLPVQYRRWTTDKSRQRLKELGKLARLPDEMLDRYPAQLSGGQRQRVSLMRALMLDPQILLLDEPLAALDPMIRSQLQSQLRDIFQSLGKTVVIVTHDLHEAAFFADEIILMQKGKVVQQATIQDLYQKPANAFVTEFIRAQQSHLPELAGGDA